MHHSGDALLTFSGLPWPPSLGDPITAKRLSGLGLGSVYDAQFASITAIVKLAKSPKERWFYESLAPRLISHGIATPKLLWSYADAERSLIVIEKIPTLLPQRRWRADAGTIATLAKLHNSGIRNDNLTGETWSAEQNRAAAELFSDRAGALDLFEEAREQSEPVLRAEHIVSGDPNGMNWGLREGGCLVLFDWERVGLGTAALDLAGVAFGEPDDSVFTAIATHYLQCPPPATDNVATLVAKMKIARIYLAALLLSRHQDGEQRLPAAIMAYYRQDFLPWCRRALG